MQVGKVVSLFTKKQHFSFIEKKFHFLKLLIRLQNG
jgi:hypothetical protein